MEGIEGEDPGQAGEAQLVRRAGVLAAPGSVVLDGLDAGLPPLAPWMEAAKARAPSSASFSA
ncbi:hypothetical protein [Pleomorphomonas koreensis]|uniref:hypothetical protein n=1 Tax=Pleomorphomonas koreensis TaxID=257440 RepID=UPI0003FDF6AE|nr:hypothetical protein [Pleomorphomonas koreensis]